MEAARARSFLKLTRVAGLIVSAVVIGEMVAATELSFSLVDGIEGEPIPDGYGDRVDRLQIRAFSYGEAGGLTPIVEVDYEPLLTPPLVASEGFGDLHNVIRMHPDADGVLELRFTADNGFVARLLSWKMAVRGVAFSEDPVMDRIEVINAFTEQVLMAEENVTMTRTGHRLFDFSGPQPLLQAANLLLRIEAHSLGERATNIALDEVVFMQCPPEFGADGSKFYGDIEFPAGDASFADRVVLLDTAAGPGPPPAVLQDEAETLGPPDYDPVIGTGAVALGGGGELVVEFVDNVLTGSGDDRPDLVLFEVDAQQEPFSVAISRDGMSWESLGRSIGGTSVIDLDAFGYDTDDRFRFVRMIDDPEDAPGDQPNPGADVDAIGAVTSAPRDGGITATFDDPVGSDNMVVTGVGTALFAWGEATSTPFPSSLRFRPGTYRGGVETEFDLGTITYVNGTTANGTTADAVSLNVLLEPGGNDENVTFVFPLELIATPNEGTPFENADIVRLPNPFSDTTVEIGGQTYRLRLAFESASAAGFTEVDRFFVLEGDVATAVLRGILTTASPLDGCLPRRLTFDHGNETLPAWDPRGDLIAFATDRQAGDFLDIGGIQANRTDERMLATDSLAPPGLVTGVLSWLGTSGKLLTTEAVGMHEVLEFDTGLAPIAHELFDEDDEAFSRVLGFSSSGGFFVLSADGRTALWRDWDGSRTTLRTGPYATLLGQSASDVGTVRREWEGNGSENVPHSASLAPDGSFFVLSERIQDVDGHDLLLFATAGAAEPVFLTTTGRDGVLNQHPAVSPDGLHIAFAATIPGSEDAVPDIHLLNLKTGETRNVTATSEIAETQPDWSPDGGSLVYSRFDGADSPELRTNEAPNWNLYVQCLEDLNDRDGDGVMDLLEEAFGSDPNTPDETTLPVPVVVTTDGITRFGIRFDVATGGGQNGASGWISGGFEYRFEVSQDLKQWSSGSGQTIAISGERLTVLCDASVSELRTHFMRVVVRRIE